MILYFLWMSTMGIFIWIIKPFKTIHHSSKQSFSITLPIFKELPSSAEVSNIWPVGWIWTCNCMICPQVTEPTPCASPGPVYCIQDGPSTMHAAGSTSLHPDLLCCVEHWVQPMGNAWPVLALGTKWTVNPGAGLCYLLHMGLDQLSILHAAQGGLPWGVYSIWHSTRPGTSVQGRSVGHCMECSSWPRPMLCAAGSAPCAVCNWLAPGSTVHTVPRANTEHVVLTAFRLRPVLHAVQGGIPECGLQTVPQTDPLCSLQHWYMRCTSWTWSHSHFTGGHSWSSPLTSSGMLIWPHWLDEFDIPAVV